MSEKKLLFKIQENLKVVLKEKNEVKISTLRMLLAEIKNEEIAKKKRGKLTDEEIQKVIKTSVKRHKDSIDTFKKGERGDLVEKEEKELEILNEYLPEKLPGEKVEKIVIEVIKKIGATEPRDFGKVMGRVMGELKGKAEGKLVSEIVKKKLEG
ncbi:MAG: glutamyl-tRNA amidotransferase [Parcubacteria group bacterium CG23_combo_of_CG06-09_8_20_14_all_35_9]|nr:MAG: glutamyl-tRNA amidotransferase [Parcubacteria group bacterium CG23_combo_of_CG06-09_8_20_14_all_35_9]